VIDSGYEAKVEEGAVVRMSSGMRDKISHEEVDQLMVQAYKAVMKEDFSAMVNRDIENNAKVVFEAIVRGIGMKNVEVIVQSKSLGLKI
jgi:molybdopterin synthase catalytic subunit